MGGVSGVWQSSWFRCAKCAVLFRAEADFVPFAAPVAQTGGNCPAGGQHDGQIGTRLAVLVGDTAAGSTGGWRRCRKCSALFLGATGTGGMCPADAAPHQEDGTDHLLAPLDAGDPAASSGWSMCTQCSSMFSSQGSDLCPATKGAHQAPSRFATRAGPEHFAIVMDRSSALPHGRACAAAVATDFKFNTQTVVQFVTLSAGEWADEPQSAWQLHFVAASSDLITSAELALQMSPRGGCIISQLTVAFTDHAINMMPSSVANNPLIVGALANGLLASETPQACANFFAGGFDDCEYNGGQNNNGIGMILTTSVGVALQVWPKREDRIRINVLLPGMGPVDFELDTHE